MTVKAKTRRRAPRGYTTGTKDFQEGRVKDEVTKTALRGPYLKQREQQKVMSDKPDTETQLPDRIYVWNDERGFGYEFALQRTAESDVEYVRVPSEADEVQQRMDAVVDAAVAWHQSGQEGDDTWFDKGEELGKAIDALLELRAPVDAEGNKNSGG